MLTADDIVCYIPVYNDAEALSRCLEKLKKMGISALVVDGRFNDFPQINDSDYSTDLTMKVCKQFGAHYKVFPPAREQTKFNHAISMAKQYDYKVFMYCGADAYFEADMPEFMLSLQRYYEQYAVEPTQLNVHAKELQPASKWNNTGTRQPRIILNYWKIEARHLHWTMYEKGQPDTNLLSPIDEIVEGIELYHDNSIRPIDRDDMMTAYQNYNVPRERDEFMEHVVPKAYDKVNMLTWKIGIDGSYETGREKFFNSKKEYTHLLVISEGYDVDKYKMEHFSAVLRKYNSVMSELPIITAVWRSKYKNNHFTLNPDGRIKSKWPKYPKIEALYSPDGLPMEANPILVAPYTGGPVLCMNKRTLQLVEHMGDELDFISIISGLGIQMHADSRIQY